MSDMWFDLEEREIVSSTFNDAKLLKSSRRRCRLLSRLAEVCTVQVT